MKELSFEEAFKRLEKIAGELESDPVSLDVSLKRYEEAMKLMAICYKKLEDTKKKVDLLVKTGEGKFQLKDFIEEAE